MVGWLGGWRVRWLGGWVVGGLGGWVVAQMDASDEEWVRVMHERVGCVVGGKVVLHIHTNDATDGEAVLALYVQKGLKSQNGFSEEFLLESDASSSSSSSSSSSFPSWM